MAYRTPLVPADEEVEGEGVDQADGGGGKLDPRRLEERGVQ